MVVYQRTLHPLLVHLFCHIDRLHGERVQFRIIHAGRQRTRRRVEVLHLIRYEPVFLKETSQLNRVVQRTARVRRNQIRNQVLLQTETLIHLSALFR